MKFRYERMEESVLVWYQLKLLSEVTVAGLLHFTSLSSHRAFITTCLHRSLPVWCHWLPATHPRLTVRVTTCVTSVASGSTFTPSSHATWGFTLGRNLFPAHTATTERTKSQILSCTSEQTIALWLVRDLCKQMPILSASWYHSK